MPKGDELVADRDRIGDILERVDRLEESNAHLQRLVEKLAARAGLVAPDDVPVKQLARPVSYADPIGALRAELARLARQGLRTWPMAIDHVDHNLFRRAAGEYARTVGAKKYPSRNMDGFETYILGRDDHVIALEEAA